MTGSNVTVSVRLTQVRCR